MDIVSILSAAMIAVSPALPVDTARSYATDIVEASDDDVELAAALFATAAVESTFRPAIANCQCKRTECDSGSDGVPRAIGLYQLHRHWWGGFSRSEICGNNLRSTWLTASALQTLAHRTGSMKSAMRAFVGCSIKDARYQKRVRLFDQVLPTLKQDQSS